MPLWSKNGRELFYRTKDQRIMVANYAARGDSFIAERPRTWFGERLANLGLAANLDVAPDGKHFIVLMPAESTKLREKQSDVTLAVNFFDEVRRRVAGQARWRVSSGTVLLQWLSEILETIAHRLCHWPTFISRTRPFNSVWNLLSLC
jgi:hypothetical protein